MQVSHPRFVFFLILIAGLALALRQPMGAPRAVSAAFDIGATIYMGWMTVIMWRSDADDIRRHAARNDSGRAALLAIAMTLAGVILVTAGYQLKPARSAGTLEIAFPVLTLVLAWVFGSIVYTLHYAHLYYDRTGTGEDKAGLCFPGTPQPRYADFAYFAFNNGMAYQVSDVQVTSTAMRRVVTVHCVIAFFFNIGVLALALNIVAGAVGGSA